MPLSIVRQVHVSQTSNVVALMWASIPIPFGGVVRESPNAQKFGPRRIHPLHSHYVSEVVGTRQSHRVAVVLSSEPPLPTPTQRARKHNQEPKIHILHHSNRPFRRCRLPVSEFDHIERMRPGLEWHAKPWYIVFALGTSGFGGRVVLQVFACRWHGTGLKISRYSTEGDVILIPVCLSQSEPREDRLSLFLWILWVQFWSGLPVFGATPE